MDFEQEIKHLIGIVLTVLLNKENRFTNKAIKFFNIYYAFDDKENDAIGWFFNAANKMVNKILVDSGKCAKFEYDHFTAQDMVKGKRVAKFNKDIGAFGTDEKIGYLLEKYFNFIID